VFAHTGEHIGAPGAHASRVEEELDEGSKAERRQSADGGDAERCAASARPRSTRTIDDEAICPICLAAVGQPFATSCGHRFCTSPCWKAHVESSGLEVTCPVCRKLVTEECHEQIEATPLTDGMVHAAALEQGQYRTIHLNSNISLDGLGLTSMGNGWGGTPLDKFLSLLSLSLDQNKLSCLNGLSLPGLRTLSLRNNRFDSLAFVHGFPGLLKLDVSLNRLSSLAGVQTAPLLSHLVARRNLLCDAHALEPIAALSAISTLEIDHNRLPLSSLFSLKSLSQLTVLAVDGNPLCHTAGDPHATILQLVPQVRILDGKVNRRAENEQHRAAMEERRRRMSASSAAMMERKRRAEAKRAAEAAGLPWDPSTFAAAPPACAPHEPLGEASLAAPIVSLPSRPPAECVTTRTATQDADLIPFIHSSFCTEVEYEHWRPGRFGNVNGRPHTS